MSLLIRARLKPSSHEQRAGNKLPTTTLVIQTGERGGSSPSTIVNGEKMALEPTELGEVIGWLFKGVSFDLAGEDRSVVMTLTNHEKWNLPAEIFVRVQSLMNFRGSHVPYC
jgi:hypothetical protein